MVTVSISVFSDHLLLVSLLLFSFETCTSFYHGFDIENGQLTRFKRQAESSTGVEDESRTLLCDFGSGSLLSECTWTYPEDDHPNVHWSKGQGSTAYWLGGPLTDHSLGDANGELDQL